MRDTIQWKLDLQEKRKSAVNKIDEIRQNKEFIHLCTILMSIKDAEEFATLDTFIAAVFPLEALQKILNDLWSERVDWLAATLNKPEILKNKSRYEWLAFCWVEDDHRYNKSDYPNLF